MRTMIKVILSFSALLAFSSCTAVVAEDTVTKDTLKAESCVQACEQQFPCVIEDDGSKVCSEDQSICKSGCL